MLGQSADKSGREGAAMPRRKMTEMLTDTLINDSAERCPSPAAVELARLLLEAAMTLRREGKSGVAGAKTDITSSNALTTLSSATEEPSGRDRDA